MAMDDQEILHQQSLVTDSFSTIERLEGEMASITREFESLDPSVEEVRNDPSRDTRSENSVKSLVSTSDHSNNLKGGTSNQNQSNDEL